MISVCNKRTYKGNDSFYIGRGSVLGNDWSHKEGTRAKHIVASAEEAVRCFEEDFRKKLAEKDTAVCFVMNSIFTYYVDFGKVDLLCYCKYKGDEPCHGDVIKKVLEEALDKRGIPYDS